MKKLIALLIVVIAIAVVLFSTFDPSEIDENVNKISSRVNNLDGRFEDLQRVLGETTEEDDPNTYEFDNLGIRVAIFDPSSLELTWQNSKDSARTFEEIAEQNDYRYAINGGYFLDNFTQAGLLAMNGEIITPIAKGDPQVSGVVMFGDGVLTFHEINEVDKVLGLLAERNTLFQTGPLLLRDSEIQTDSINTAPNNSEANLRSVLGTLSDGRAFFLLTDERYTLDQLSEEILNLEIFEGMKINAINLDGGSSVAIYSESESAFGFGKVKRLPFIIGVR